MRWVILLMNDRCSSCPLMRGFIWCANPLPKDNICGGYNCRDWCLPVVKFRQYLQLPQSFEVISLPQKSNSNRLVMMIQICSFVHLLHLIFHIVVVNTAFSDWVYICEVDVPAKFWSCIAYVIKEADCSCGTQSLFFDLLPRSHLRHSDRPNFNLVRKY